MFGLIDCAKFYCLRANISFNSLEEGLSCFRVLDPALLIGFDIIPLGFELVAESPKELAFNGMVEDVTGAISKPLHVSITEES
jgi:hypothetical protein